MKQRLQSQWPIASFWLIRKRRFPIKIQVKEISGNLCKRSVRMIQEARYETKATKQKLQSQLPIASFWLRKKGEYLLKHNLK